MYEDIRNMVHKERPAQQRLASSMLVFVTISLFALVLLGRETAVSAVPANQTIQNQVAEQTSRTYLPLSMNRYDASLPTPLFGVQLYGNTLPNNKYFDDLVDSGATWVRIPVMWNSAEPERLDPPKEYNWTAIDRALSAARTDNGNLQIIGTITHAPEWAAPGIKAPIYDEMLPDFVQFVQAVVERYNGDGINDALGSPVVTYWEFYNEPDAGERPGDLRWGESGDKYAEMLAAVYPAVKAANPQVKVVFGGIAYDWFQDQGGPFVREFLDDVLAAGGGQYFDIMNFHSYPAFSLNWTGQGPEGGPGLLEKSNFIRNKLQNEYGLYKPMIITEAGWHSNNPPNHPSNPEIQARYVVKLFTQSIAADIDVMIWWMFYDPGGGYWDNGLVTNATPPARKLSYTVYQNIVEELSTTHYQRRLPPSETGNAKLEAYQFTDWVHQRTLYIAWLNPVNGNEGHPLLIPATAATVKSMEGNLIGVIMDGDDGIIDGKVTVTIGSRPIYIEVKH
jgi:hypothetical protein